MNIPLVSIITPTYNHQSFIADCICSVQQQTYDNWEMIIVDDGSTDNTYSIAQSFAEKDGRVKVFTQKNVGIYRLAETYNFALSKSSGSYAAVLEGDDVWLPEKLEIQVKALEENKQAVLCWGKAYRTTDVTNERDLYPTPDVEARYGQDLRNEPIMSASINLLFHQFYFPALTVFIRRSALDKIGGFIQNHNLPLVDLPTWVELSTQGTFEYIDLPLGKWRINSNQITKTLTVEMYKGFYNLTVDFFNQHQDVFANQSINMSVIKRHYRKLFVIIYSRSGRYKLIRKDFAGARKDYLKSIFNFGLNEPLWKLRSLVGFFFSLIHSDIEKFTKRIGRVSYK